MKNKTLNVLRPLCFLSLTLALSGCFLTDARKSFIDNVVETTPTSEYIEEVRQTESQKQFDDHVKEWESIKPQLVKMIEMTQELEYVMQMLEDKPLTQGQLLEEFAVDEAKIINQQISSQPLNDSDDNVPISTLQPTVADLVGLATGGESINTYNAASEINDTEIDAKFSGGDFSAGMVDTALVKTPLTVTGAAKPLLSMQELSSDTGLGGVNDNKFRNVSSDSNIPSEELRKEQNIAYTALDECDTPLETRRANGQDFAIHLASYLNQSNLQKGFLTLQNENKQIFCGKSAVVKPVSVNGKDYFSLRLGPYLNRSEAVRVCKEFTQNNDYCSVTQFEGEVL